jgi:hypothetical protein
VTPPPPPPVVVTPSPGGDTMACYPANWQNGIVLGCTPPVPEQTEVLRERY